MSLVELLDKPAPALNAAPPSLRRPYVKHDGDGVPVDIVTGDVDKATTKDEQLDAVRRSCNVTIPDGYELVLVEAWHNETAWARDSVNQELAVTKPTWRYRFKVERKSPLEDRMRVTEIDDWISKRRFKPRTAAGEHAEIVNLADLQIGKVDERGGTEQLQERFFMALEEVKVRLKKSKPATIILSELGDGCENFENTPVQAHTNDRNLVAQLDMHHEFLFHAVKELAPLAPKMIVVGVPSNHMEVRKDGKAIGGPDNDYGLLTMAGLERSFSLNPKAYGHVQFVWPDPYEVSIVLPVAGQNVAFTHGHFARGAGAADNVPKWMANQFAGRVSRLDEATILFTGHYHHLRFQQIIGGRWWFQAPALDSGSAWLKRINGQGSSDAGILVVRVDADGWSDMAILGNRTLAAA